MFIAIDGMDGAGKSTLIKDLIKYFASKAENIDSLRQPVIRHKDFPDKNNPSVQDFLINFGKGNISSSDFQMICVKERLDYLREYEADTVVMGPDSIYIAGRWSPSGTVFGMIDLVKNFKFTEEEAFFVSDGQNVMENEVFKPLPFIGIILVCSPEMAMTRIAGRGEGFSVYEEIKTQRMAKKYLEFFANYHLGYVVIDTTTLTPKETLDKVIDLIESSFSGCGWDAGS